VVPGEFRLFEKQHDWKDSVSDDQTEAAEVMTVASETVPADDLAWSSESAEETDDPLAGGAIA